MRGIRRILIQFVVLFFFFGSMPVPQYAQDSPGETKQRNFMLVFDMIQYSPELEKALDHFFQKVFQKGDQLILGTPLKFYGYTPENLALPTKQLVADVLKKIKDDILTGGAKYRAILEEMTRISQKSRRVGGWKEDWVPTNLKEYVRLRKSLMALRASYEKRLVAMAKIFRRIRGDNHLLMFLQNISRPVPVDQKESGYHLSDTVSSDAFAAENPDPGFDMKKVEIVFKLAKVKFHFMYFPIKGLGTRREIEYVDHNSDLYDFFSKNTKMTGGIKLTSANPSAFIKGVGQLILTGTVEVEILDEKMEE